MRPILTVGVRTRLHALIASKEPTNPDRVARLHVSQSVSAKMERQQLQVFIVDSQVHIWKEETPDRPWVPGARERIRLNGHREEAFLYEECLELMDEAGVDRVIIVPPSWEGDRIDYSLEAAEAHPDRFGIMARVPQNKPEEGKALMREFAAIDAIKGIRLTFHRPIDRNWMIDGTCDWIWPYAEELGIKIMVHAPIWKVELGKIAEQHPGLNIIIDHMGIMARCVDDAIGYWVQETADLHDAPEHLREDLGAARVTPPTVPEREHLPLRQGDDREDGSGALPLGHRHHPSARPRPDVEGHDRAVHRAHGPDRRAA